MKYTRGPSRICIVQRLVVVAVAVLSIRCSIDAASASTSKHHHTHSHKYAYSTTQQQPARRYDESSWSSSLSSVYHHNYYPRRRQQQQEQSSSVSEPHSLTLHLTFDSHPEEVSWKFQNARTQKVLDGVGFGVYDADMVGQTVQESINILNDLDYEGDANYTLREYRFVIYDRGGNGICCTNGNGKYEIYSKGSVVAEGSAFGSIEESLFSIDPRDYLGEEADGSQTTATTASVGSTSLSTSVSVGDISSPAPNGVNNNENSNNNSTDANDVNTIVNNNSTNQQQPSLKPTSKPQEQSANDQTWWFCGISWDWVTSHCDEAKPCPGGDAVDCPANHACFASTPCTLAPSERPSTDPSSMPSEVPSPSPTNAPWSEATLIGFLNGESDNNENDGAENAAAATNSKNTTEVNEILENDSSLQYHFYCGISWTHADETCDVYCPSGDKSDCPSGQECFANTRCDGRITASPTSVPASGVNGTDSTNITGEDLCSLCNGKLLEPDKSITFQQETTTCGSLDAMLISAMQAEDDPVVQSATCNSVREMYKNDCCTEECQLCMTSGGNLLDLKGDVVVQQGGYDARCHDISGMLSTSYSAKDSMCADARTVLAGKCCYQQCTLCGDQSESESTFWFNTVIYQDLTTTCLGLDYLLRAELLMDGSDRCSELQAQYTNQCCFQTANSCQLCEGEVQYELDSNKIVTVKGSLTTKPCSAVNFSMAKYQKSDAQCMEDRQAYFGECCVLNKDAGTEFDPTSTGGSEVTNSSPLATPAGPNTATYAPPTATAGVVPGSNSSSNGDAGEVSTTVVGETAGDNITVGSRGQSATVAPSQSIFWGSPSEFDWEQVWDPPDRNSGLHTHRLAPILLCGLFVQLLHVFG